MQDCASRARQRGSRTERTTHQCFSVAVFHSALFKVASLACNRTEEKHRIMAPTDMHGSARHGSSVVETRVKGSIPTEQGQNPLRWVLLRG